MKKQHKSVSCSAVTGQQIAPRSLKPAFWEGGSKKGERQKLQAICWFACITHVFGIQTLRKRKLISQIPLKINEPATRIGHGDNEWAELC